LRERFVFLVSDRNVQLVVLVVAILTCIAAWLVVPQVQQAIFGPTPSLTVIRSETVVLRTSRDRYVTAMDDQPGWNWELRAETRNLGDWEKFTLLCLNNGKIALKTHHDRYVTATDATYEWKLRAETRNLGDWEQFTVVNAETEKEVPCSEVFGLFEQIALRTSHGRYVTAMNDQPGWNWELRAETRSLSYWEKFTLAPTD
jgi:hypothetical protein